MQSFCGQELLMEQCRVVTWRSSVCLCFQLRPLRRRFPHRVSAESSAVSPLRSERAAPQEAVVLLVTRWRQPRLLPPALPEHLRTVRAPPRRLLDRKPRLQVRAFHAAVALWRPEPPQLPRQAMQTERMSSSHVHAQIWNRTLRLVSFSFFLCHREAKHLSNLASCLQKAQNLLLICVEMINRNFFCLHNK